jgi:hypothetical protein
MIIPWEVLKWLHQTHASPDLALKLLTFFDNTSLKKASTVAEMISGSLQSTDELKQVSLRSISDKLCVRRATLQNRLQTENTSFPILLNQERQRRYRAYLSVGMPMEKISEIIGFSNVNIMCRTLLTCPPINPRVHEHLKIDKNKQGKRNYPHPLTDLYPQQIVLRKKPGHKDANERAQNQDGESQNNKSRRLINTSSTVTERNSRHHAQGQEPYPTYRNGMDRDENTKPAQKRQTIQKKTQHNKPVGNV